MAKKQTKQPKRFRGISPYAIALVYEGKSEDNKRDVFQADNPFVYAEARLGIAPRYEAEQAFNQLVEDILSGRCKTDLPMLRQWVVERKKQKKQLSFDDLEKRIQKRNKSLSLTREEAVQDVDYSSQETLIIKVRARSSARKEDTLKKWDVDMSNFSLKNWELHPNFRRNCHCGFQGKNTNKRRLWTNEGKEKEYLDSLVANPEIDLSDKDIGRELHLACYHEAVAAIELELQNNKGKEQTIPRLEGKQTTIAFDFINKWDLVFEAMVRKYKHKQDMADIDAYLWEQDILTGEFKENMERGIVNKELIKSRRVFDPMAKKIIQAIYERMHSQGYKFRGFAREFIGFKNRYKDYESVGIVFEKDKADKSYRVVYAPESNINLPIIVEKRFVNPDFEKPKPRKYQRTPYRLFIENKEIKTLDDRTGKVAKT